MIASSFSRPTSRRRRRAASARVSSLILLLQRSPLVKLLLPESRVLSSSAFSDVVKWSITAVTGLGAFDSVAKATTIVQRSPNNGLLSMSVVAGSNLNFIFQVDVQGGYIPALFQVTGTIPGGLTQTGTRNNTIDSITGAPTQTGSFPVTITAWEFANNTGFSAAETFTISVTNPPVPTITSQPVGGNYAQGSFVTMVVGHTTGFNFTWKKDGTPLPAGETVVFAKSAPRRFFFPLSDPGAAWRSGAAFDDSAWTAVSGGIGYDTSTAAVNYLPHIAAGGNVQAKMSGAGKPTSVFLRLPFALSTPAALSYLKLRIQSDDGFVAWLNGTEVASQNKPATLAWNSASGGDAVDANAIIFREIDITSRLGLLRGGANLLAVQGLNAASSSSDFLFNAELAGGINASNSARLILATVQPADAGTYTVTVANQTNSVISEAAVINLLDSSLTISTQPSSVSINSGETTTLHVAATGATPFTYQWYRGISGDTADPIAGAIGDSFTTPPLTTSTSYWVRVTNAASSADSGTAVVTVRDIPPAISSHPPSVSINKGDTATLNVVATGTGPFSYQWYRGLSGDTSDLIAGAVGASFTTPALTDTTSYWVRVTNAASSADSNTAVVTVSATVPDPFTAWQNDHFTPAQLANPAISGPAADPDGDGIPNDHEYIFGSLPFAADSPFKPAVTSNGGKIGFSFTARRATGAGYEGRTRHYAVESSPDTAGVPWETATGFADIIADDQTVAFTQTIEVPRKFFRLKVWLTP